MGFSAEQVKAVGRKIRRLRLERDWTQAELGKRAGIDGKNVSNYETDNLKPSERTLQKLAQAFSIGLDELLSDAPSEVLAIEDPDLLALFQEVAQLPDAERSHTKWILGTVIKQNRIQKVVAG